MTIVLGHTEPSGSAHADELCDALMEHIFECDSCINGSEENCCTYCSLQEQIAQAGGPTKGVCFVM